MDLLIDFETLGLGENAAPLTFGITAFDLEDEPSIDNLKENSLYIKFDKNEVKVEKKGYFSVDKDTLDWWKNQSKEAKDFSLKPSKNEVSLEKACLIIKKFAEKKGYSYRDSYIWCRGMDFDLPKLKYLYKVANIAYPFNPFKGRDIRTYVDILGGVDNGIVELDDHKYNSLARHNPMNDTIRDAYLMQTLYQQFGEE